MEIWDDNKWIAHIIMLRQWYTYSITKRTAAVHQVCAFVSMMYFPIPFCFCFCFCKVQNILREEEYTKKNKRTILAWRTFPDGDSQNYAQIVVENFPQQNIDVCAVLCEISTMRKIWIMYSNLQGDLFYNIRWFCSLNKGKNSQSHLYTCDICKRSLAAKKDKRILCLCTKCYASNSEINLNHNANKQSPRLTKSKRKHWMGFARKYNQMQFIFLLSGN